MSAAVDCGWHSRIFLSYARSDAELAIWLRNELSSAGFEVFRDLDDTLPGEEWWRRLTGLIEASDTVVFLLSPRSALSKVCADEVAYAQHVCKRIIPAVVEEVDWVSVPHGLAKIHGVYLTPPERRAAAFETLRVALLTDIEWIREHTRLNERALRWNTRERIGAELLIGETLRNAEMWCTKQPDGCPPPTTLELDYIRISREAEQIALEARLADIERKRKAIEEQRDLAEQSLAAARKTAAGMTTSLVREANERVGFPKDLARKILDIANDLLQTLAATEASSPTFELEIVTTLSDSISVLITRGDLTKAQQVAENAAGKAQALCERHPGDLACQKQLAICHSNLGDVFRVRGNLPDALSAYKIYASLCEQMRCNDRHTRALLAHAYGRLDLIYSYQGRHQEAFEHLRQATSIREDIAHEFPDEFQCQRQLANSYFNLGAHHQLQASWNDALGSYEKALDIRERCAAADPNNAALQSEIGACFVNIGVVQLSRNQFSSAEEALEQGAEYFERLYRLDISNLVWAHDFASARRKQGDVAHAQGRTATASEHFGAAAAILRELTTHPPSNVSWLQELAETLLSQSRDHRPGADTQKCKRLMDEASSLVDALIQDSPDNADLASLRARINSERVRFSKTWRSLWS